VRITEIEHELSDLHDGDVLLPPNANATCALEIIPVHDDMDTKVQGDGHPGDSSMTDELGIAEKSGCAMVISMQEGWEQSVTEGARRVVFLLTQWLFLQEEEAGIDQLQKLGEIIELQKPVSKISRNPGRLYKHSKE